MLRLLNDVSRVVLYHTNRVSIHSYRKVLVPRCRFPPEVTFRARVFSCRSGKDPGLAEKMHSPHKKNGIPDRWLDYQAVGQRMPGTRFIAFKVPLKQSLNCRVSKSAMFGPWELLDVLQKKQQELGLIIDLTFTKRYYGLQDLPDSLSYVKIFTAGHAVPSDATILSFKRVVRKFLQDNADNDRLIGVHCTHGLNRTGYLVCRYLIDVDDMPPLQAIQLFGSSRGHPIERQNYIQDLISGPKRSNQGMEESEQDSMRGTAVERPQCEPLAPPPRPRFPPPDPDWFHGSNQNWDAPFDWEQGPPRRRGAPPPLLPRPPPAGLLPRPLLPPPSFPNSRPPRPGLLYQPPHQRTAPHPDAPWRRHPHLPPQGVWRGPSPCALPRYNPSAFRSNEPLPHGQGGGEWGTAPRKHRHRTSKRHQHRD